MRLRGMLSGYKVQAADQSEGHMHCDIIVLGRNEV